MKVKYKTVTDKVFWNEGKWSLHNCTNCNLMSLYPAPTKDEIGKYYQTYYTHVTEKSFIKQKIDSLSKKVLRSHYFSYTTSIILPDFIKSLFTYEIYKLKKTDGVEIFDVGFGNGNFISKMTNLNVYPSGCDFDEKCVQLVRNNYNVETFHGALCDVITQKKYDILTYGHVVEHLYSLKDELKEVRLKLKPGGKVVGLTPNIESLGHKLFKSNWRGLEPPRHLHLYSQTAIKKIAEECGFSVTVLKTTSRFARHILAASLMIKLNRRATISGGGRGPWIALAGYLLQVIEWLLNCFMKNLGEEIYFVLEKKSHEN